MRQDFIGLGIPENKILVGGYPRLAPLSLNDKKEARDLLNAQGGEAGKKVVVLLSSSLGEEKPTVELFMSAQNLASDCYFMVRPHPSENLSWYKTHMAGGLQRMQDPRRWSLAQSLALADMVVGSGSTACIDALILGKRLILIPERGLNYNDRPMLHDAIKRRVGVIAANAKELAGFVCEEPWDVNQAAESYAQECALCLGAEAARLTSNLLQNMITN